ncbi:unnamed protein product [Rhizophagus irregularis]|nr:unnamed protein product [Rhizophagus irregularis]
MSLSASFLREDIRVVVSIEFGTTYSGYGYAHRISPDDISVENKTPAIIKYEDDNTTVKCWGSSALPSMRNTDQSKPIELFKLYPLKEPSIPELQNYKRIIIDYLKKLGEKIKESINGTWEVEFNSQVLIVFTIPTEFDDEKIEIMRYCVHKAELIQKKDSGNLVFITKLEAVAIYCLNFVDEIIIKIVPKISVPSLPVIAVIKGGVKFGLEVESVVKRVLKRTYGTNIVRKSKLGDPSSDMLPNGYTVVFETIASRGKEILVNDKVIKELKLTSSMQRSVNFNIYVTKEPEAKFCSDLGVSLLCRLEIELPDDDDDDDYDDVVISLILTFGTVEILATAKNKKTGENYRINQKPGVKIRI